MAAVYFLVLLIAKRKRIGILKVKMLSVGRWHDG